MDLHNETLVNVAALVGEPIGSFRQYPLKIDVLDLGDGLQAIDIEGDLVLTRLSNEILATMRGTFLAALECQRCLDRFEHPDSFELTESFLISEDWRNAEPDESDEVDDEPVFVSPAHEIDIGETIRQEILVSLPMRPVCGPNCEGLLSEVEAEEDEIDSRFAALSQLLHD